MAVLTEEQAFLLRPYYVVKAGDVVMTRACADAQRDALLEYILTLTH